MGKTHDMSEMFRRGPVLYLLLLWNILSTGSAISAPFQLLGAREPFWRGSVVVSPYTTNGWLLLTSPDYLRDDTLSFPVAERPYAREIPCVDDVFFVRPLGGLQDSEGSPLPELDFVCRDGETLAFRTNLITAQLQPYLDVGYSNCTIVLDNVPWCLPETPLTGDYGQKAPEADLNEWYETVQVLCRHLKFLLGENRANQLRFRVGTEADWAQRWSGTEAEFFDHYDYSVAAVRSVLPEAQIGPFNKIGGAVFDGSFQNVTYTNLAQHCIAGVNAKTGETGVPFGWASASYYYNESVVDPDEAADNLESFFEAVDLFQPGVAREVQEFGVLKDSTGLVSYESGSRGAALVFHTLARFAGMGVSRSKTAWDKTTFERFTSADDDRKLLAGQGWAMNIMEHIYRNGDVALPEIVSTSSVGTLWQAVASGSSDGSRMLMGISSFNPDPLVTDSETVHIAFPASFFTLPAPYGIRSIRYDRENAVYEIIRRDLLQNGLLSSDYEVPHRPVSKLDHMGIGWPSKDYVADNWTSGSNYQACVQANLILTPESAVGITQDASGDYTVELEIEPDSVVVLEIYSSEFIWDGGASTSDFGDASNWDPDGTDFAPADRYLIEDGSSVIADSDLSIAGFDLRNSSLLVIGTGTTMTINGNLQTLLDDGTLTVDGTIDFGSNRWDAGGVGTHTVIDLNGTWISAGNFYGGAQKSITINVNGSFMQKLSAFGATVDIASEVRSNVVNVGSSGTYTASGGLVLKGTEKNVTAVVLNGGTMEVPDGAVYNYSNLILSGDDGIIFTDPASQLVLEGDRTADVDTWISEGALSSQVGLMGVAYDSEQDQTVVAIQAVSGPFYWDGGAGTTEFEDTSNWDPDGTSFTTEDQFLITNGAAVVAASDHSVGALDLLGGSSLTIDAGQTFTFNQNNVSDLDDGTLIVNGNIDFGGNRWNSGGVSTHTIINVNGTWTSSGNFYAGSQKSIAVNVNGSFIQKLSSFGAMVDYALEVRTNVVNVGSGGTYTAFGSGLVLKGTERNVTAVLLNGGTMLIPAGAAYDYTSLILSGDDGIIFTDAGSQIILDGNRTNDVSAWIADGALSSQIGTVTFCYDDTEDHTCVAGYSASLDISEAGIEVLHAADQLAISWYGIRGASYAVQSTTDLVFGIWSDIFTNLTGNNSLISVTGTVNEAQEYFRIYLEE